MIIIKGSSLTVDRSIFQYADGNLGGVFKISQTKPDQSYLIKHTQFRRNNATEGGVIYLRGGGLTITDCLFEMNKAYLRGSDIVLYPSYLGKKYLHIYNTQFSNIYAQSVSVQCKQYT